MRLQIFGTTLFVQGTYTPYRPGTVWEPPSEAEFEVDTVLLPDGSDITELLENLYTSKGVPALVEIGNEAAKQSEREDMARPLRAFTYLPPVGCGC